MTDGKSHLMDFRVDGVDVGTRGSELRLARPGTVRVTAQVAARLPKKPPNEAIAAPLDKEAVLGPGAARASGGTREVPVELIVNGRRRDADGSSPTARCAT